MMRAGYSEAQYSRNHDKAPDIEHELGDVYLMLATLATLLDVDLDAALDKRIEHFRNKYGATE